MYAHLPSASAHDCRIEVLAFTLATCCAPAVIRAVTPFRALPTSAAEADVHAVPQAGSMTAHRLGAAKRDGAVCKRTLI